MRSVDNSSPVDSTHLTINLIVNLSNAIFNYIFCLYVQKKSGECALICISEHISKGLFDRLSKRAIGFPAYHLTRTWHIVGLLISFTLQQFAYVAFYICKTIWQLSITDICFWKYTLVSNLFFGQNVLNSCSGVVLHRVVVYNF